MVEAGIAGRGEEEGIEACDLFEVRSAAPALDEGVSGDVLGRLLV